MQLLHLFDGIFYQKNGHPGQANIVEGYCSIERVVFARCAVTVVLIPIDAFRPVDRGILHTEKRTGG